MTGKLIDVGVDNDDDDEAGDEVLLKFLRAPTFLSGETSSRI